MGTRRALIIASGSRYAVVLLQVVASLFVAHHVLPDQFGLTVLGNGALLLAGALRDLGTVGYLVQQKDLAEHQVRSAFTISFLVTVIVTLLLLAIAQPVAAFYHDPRLVGYLRLMAAAYALGPLMNPVMALLTREMAFKRMAVIDVGSGVVGMTATVALVYAGFGFVSVAWAAIAKAVAALLLCFWVRRDLWRLRPSLRAWRGVIGFGFHGSATALVYSVSEALVYLMLGKLANVHVVGLIQRSYLLTQIPERVLLAGVGAVALPTFAGLSREGKPLVPTYINTIRLIVPVYLAAMLALIVLARPLVEVLLGLQWLEVVRLMQIIAAGHLVGVGVILNLTVLVAVGGIGRTTPLALFQAGVLLAAVAIAAPFGSVAIAATALFATPVSTFASYLVVRRFIPFAWRDVSCATLFGAVIAGIANLPGLVIVGSGWMAQWPLAIIALSVVAGAICWLGAIRVLHHPLGAEIAHVAQRLHAIRDSRRVA